MENLRTKLLKTTDDLKKALQVPFKVRKERKQLESWNIDKEQKIAELEDEIQELKAGDDLNIDSLLSKRDDLQLTERKLVQGEELLEELFNKTASE